MADKRLTLRVFMLVVALMTTRQATGQRGPGGIVRARDGSAVGRQWLFVIGIDKYQNWRAWPELDCAVSDVKAVRDVLTQRYHIDHVEELYDAHATRTALYDKLRWLGQNTKPGDSLMIYYAGHGQLDDFEGIGFWVPVDGTRNPATWLGCDRIRRAVANMPAKHVLLVSDTCFAGDFFRERTGIPDINQAYYRRSYAKRSRQAMTSGGLEPAADAALKGHSPFAYWLIDALRTNTQPYLVPNELFSEIKLGVARNSNQTPRVGYLHGAQDAGGEFIFFLREPTSKSEALGAAVSPLDGDALLPVVLSITGDETNHGDEHSIWHWAGTPRLQRRVAHRGYSLGPFSDSDYIVVSPHVVSQKSEGRIDFWMYLEALSTECGTTPLSWDEGDDVFGFISTTAATDPGLGNITFNLKREDIKTGKAVVRLRRWQHIEISWDGRERRIYVDSDLIAAVRSNMAFGKVQQFVIGKYVALRGYAVRGYLDEIRVRAR